MSRPPRAMRLLDCSRAAALSAAPLDLRCAPADLLEALCQADQPVLLDSSAAHDSFGRYCVLTCCPLEVLTLAGGKLTTADGTVQAEGADQLWAALRRAFAAVRLEERADACAEAAPPYGPGWFGYLGYELGRCVERLPGRAPRDTPLGDLRLGFHDAALVYDGAAGRWWLMELKFADPPAGAGLAADALRRIAAAGETSTSPHATAAAACGAPATPVGVESDFTPGDYRRAVGRCMEYIAAGDIFQVNLSQRFTLSDQPQPADIYRCLRHRNPAWYAAYLAFQAGGQACAVLSSSPELFLRVRGGHVTTRPIKGTRPRVGNADADRAAAAELLASPKDNAELAMIIDLLRNDLGRVCRFGSVRVAEPRRLEEHPTVLHLVGTVEGVLRGDVGPSELLRATLPGGSITGAPKIRAMEIIDELEPVARGVYTGCIGWVGVNGDAEWNIAIRTIVCVGDRACVQVGGGIVADSTPQGEYDETLDKARALLEALAEAQRRKA